MKVELSRRALTDLDEISTFYLEQAGRPVAVALEMRIREVIERIGKRPESAPPVIGRPESALHR